MYGKKWGYNQMEHTWEHIHQALDKADAIIIGASNGLSIAEGYHIFADNDWFRQHFQDFRQTYSIRSPLQGLLYPYPHVEEKWGFVSRLASLLQGPDGPGQVMKDLYQLVKDTPYFVLTSNGEDHFVPAGFSRDAVFEMEGTLTSYRCSRHCCDDVWYDRPGVLHMAAAEKDGVVPSQYIPRCPHCQALVEPNLPADEAFFRTTPWQKKAQAYQQFLQTYSGKRIVILELGIGWRNQMIKKPLMELAVAEPQAVYITINKGEVYIPQAIQDRSIGVDGDIATALSRLAALQGR